MSVKITGLKALERELEKRLGKDRMLEITDKALYLGAKEFVKILIGGIKAAGHKGYSKNLTVDGIRISKPFYENSVRTIKIHWNDGKGTYRIIHLNEWGTIRIPNPPRKGVIAKSLKEAKNVYRATIMAELKRSI